MEISSLLLVLRSNGIRCTSIRSKNEEFILFADNYNDIYGIFEEEVMSALRIINCDLVMPRDFKVIRSLIDKSRGTMLYNREINEIKETIEKLNSMKDSEAIKLPYSIDLKTFSKSQIMVPDACERGLILFDL